MATVSKKEIVKTVSERHGLTTTQTAQIIQVFMDQIIEELSRGNRIEFREFGIFELKRRKPRVARNPKTGDSVDVPEKTVVSFKPGKVMKAKVVDTEPSDKTAEKPAKRPTPPPAPRVERPAAVAPAPRPAPLPAPVPKAVEPIEKPVLPPPPKPAPKPDPEPTPPSSPSSFY